MSIISLAVSGSGSSGRENALDTKANLTPGFSAAYSGAEGCKVGQSGLIRQQEPHRVQGVAFDHN